jgi:hypothetical protein
VIAQIQAWVEKAESLWLQPLKDHCVLRFARTFLPSHDASHHGRVWHNCKQLLNEASAQGAGLSYEKVEALLMAAWFHDVGMSVDQGPVHGELGSRMYRDFVKKADEVVLEAIRRHDDKETLVYASIGPGTGNEVLDFLSVADDLDALGTVGIYRYAEIYLHRGTGLEALGTRVLANATLRYNNLLRSCSGLPPALVRIHETFDALQEFYHLYNQQLARDTDPSGINEGPLGIINTLRRLVMDEGVRPEKVHERLRREGARPGLIEFYNALRYELEQA